MPKNKLPWRTLAPPGPSGRLDPVLVRKAILEVKAESEARDREQTRVQKEKERRSA
ncbi:hypothetical protein [Longimicrobium sp.]|uniref:hypothetical protein n=1 Tax=Longimicrobium sp. TaxID=2029185 RepID=UPI003B3A974D